MATCFCKQPCAKHKSPMLRTKEDFLRAINSINAWHYDYGIKLASDIAQLDRLIGSK